MFLNLNYNTRNFDSITLLVRILKRSLDEPGNKNFLLRKIEKIKIFHILHFQLYYLPFTICDTYIRPSVGILGYIVDNIENLTIYKNYNVASYKQWHIMNCWLVLVSH